MVFLSGLCICPSQRLPTRNFSLYFLANTLVIIIIVIIFVFASEIRGLGSRAWLHRPETGDDKTRHFAFQKLKFWLGILKRDIQRNTYPFISFYLGTASVWNDEFCCDRFWVPISKHFSQSTFFSFFTVLHDASVRFSLGICSSQPIKNRAFTLFTASFITYLESKEVHFCTTQAFRPPSGVDSWETWRSSEMSP